MQQHKSLYIALIKPKIMKNIIVPIDFSACATNALHYAIALAVQLESKLHVVYVHNPQIVLQTMSVDVEQSMIVPMPIPDEDYVKMNLVEKELENYPTLISECYIKQGFLDDILLDLASQQKAGMIVMGTQGAHDKLSLWTGSNTAKIVERKKIAVLSVPETFTAKLTHKAEFIMATDFELINDWSVMDPFYDLALKLNANINVFYVKDKFQEKDLTIYEKEMFEQLVEFFKDLKVTLHHSNKSDIVEAVDQYASETKSTLVMMVAHERGWLDELFHKSITKDMTLHGHVPLLSIPDGKAELNKAYTAGYW